ncbi:MAG: hypothetical protein WBV46_19650 [Terriglobales bacterium]
MGFRIKYACVLTMILALWAVALSAGRSWILSHPTMSAPAKPVGVAPACTAATQKSQQAGFRAKRNLAPNHWIREKDLDWAAPSAGSLQKTDFLNRYSACPIHAGDLVLASETGLLPQVEPTAGHVAYPLDIRDPRALQTINAGSRIDIWDQTHVVTQNTAVLAVICKSDSPPNDCSAIVDAAADEFSRLQSSKVESLRIVFRQAKP